MAKNIVLANGKGGVGKSTIAALLVEWLNHRKISVGIFDGDPNQTLQTWALYCEQEGRPVAVPHARADVTIVDTAGASGSALTWIQKSDMIICPFKANFADLDLSVSWFRSLNSALQKRVVFVPNMVGVASEQRNGLQDIQKVVKEVGAGLVLESCFLKNRDAIYPDILKGLATNFFDLGTRFRPAQNEAKLLAKSIMKQAGVST